VVSGVRSGTISLVDACQRCQLSAEEFSAWQAAFEIHGIGALRGTRSQRWLSPEMTSGARPLSYHHGAPRPVLAHHCVERWCRFALGMCADLREPRTVI